ncbi:hypothetical protein LWM68_08450 [Niabella sp. W65]|nr:hypothetical protein [Niabella sp. W65]MCH7362793.1 hypothetical protein [Niabella sp. W65]ULT38747.1 hypothetical protein KRR40_27135 [Niabella sp. I65]
MQQKLFDDIEQLQLPEELMTYTPGFISREEGNKLLKLLLDTVPGSNIKRLCMIRK